MRHALLLVALTASLIPTSAVKASRPAGPRAHLAHWTAVSTTAMGITGDIEVGEHQITIDGAHRYKIEKIRSLSAPEVDAAMELASNRALKGWVLYKINIPASSKLRNGSTICGREPATRVIVATGPGYGGEELSLIFLSGAKEPFFEGWRSTTDSGVCGSFGYARRRMGHRRRLARQLETDDDEARFDERPKKLDGAPKPAPEKKPRDRK